MSQIVEYTGSHTVALLYGHEGTIPEFLWVLPWEVDGIIERFKETGELEIRRNEVNSSGYIIDKVNVEIKKPSILYIAKEMTMIQRRSDKYVDTNRIST